MHPLELEFTVDCPPEHAFDTWARRIGTWWPKGHLVSGDPGLIVVLEPRVGGRIYERTPDGTEHDWGEVLAWDPPHGSATWGTSGSTTPTRPRSRSPSAGDASKTTVTIVHRGWERLGARGEEWRERNRRGCGGRWRTISPPALSRCREWRAPTTTAIRPD